MPKQSCNACELTITPWTQFDFFVILRLLSLIQPEDRMAQPAQIEELSAKHQALERMIQDEIDRPGSSDLKIAELKRRKLQLKDQMTKLESRRTRH